jgi:hypothetical protein
MRLISVLNAILVGFAFVAHAQASATFEAAKKIAGKYTGTWTMYGIENGKVARKAAWTDVLTAGNPTEEKDRAFVQVSDVMTFTDGTTRTSNFIEGYISNADGSVGDRFYDLGGTTTHFKQLTQNDWSYQATPADGELWFLGFDPKTVVSASHVAIKTTTFDGSLDTDHVTRMTTIQWKDATGALKSTQFVSLQGEHRRMAE